MEMTQQDYEARKQRVEAGVGTDEDARLVKQYERDGYTTEPKAEPDPAPDTDDAAPDDGSAGRGRGRGAGRNR